MKRILSVVVVLVTVLLLLSAFNPRKKGLKAGNLAPEIELCDTTLSSFGLGKGGYTLLHFWASYDALSRIANIRYNRVVEETGDAQLRYIAVSYDRNAALFGEIVKRDGVNAACQYYDRSGKRSSLYERYRLSTGFASYLIAPDGTIVAENPSPQTLANILGR